MGGPEGGKKGVAGEKGDLGKAERLQTEMLKRKTSSLEARIWRNREN